MGQEEIKKAVQDRYGKIAQDTGLYCFPSVSCCRGENIADKIGRGIGYSAEELRSVPEGANLGLGCGNPLAYASLKEGETVVDLGSGAGFDCFLAANQAGKDGQVIGVDMTPGMIDKTRENARKGGYRNVEFRLGEIENLPGNGAGIDSYRPETGWCLHRPNLLPRQQYQKPNIFGRHVACRI